MRFSRKRRGSIYLQPGCAHWVIATQTSDGPVLEKSGQLEVEGAVFPPPPESLNPLFEQKRVQWNLQVPLTHRAALVPFPPVAEQEMAQGAHWQAERTFRMADLDPVYDYEPWPTQTGAEGTRSCPTMLVAIKETTLTHWREWMSRLASPPARLEPVFTAIMRSIGCMARTRPQYEGNVVCVWRDRASAGIAIYQNGNPLAIRNLGRGIPREEEAPPLSGEEGIRQLRETILSCEDRYPRLVLDGIAGFGVVTDGWMDDASSATQLPALPPPPPPRGWEEFADNVDKYALWPALFGGLLGE